MKQPLYIISSCSISPQHTYDEEHFLSPVVSSNENKLYVIDPDYTKFISPVAIRRMSRLLKRGITASMKCLENAGVTTPDGIIIGTARGSVTDMENFLRDMINMHEEALNPTSFIQSTYNSVNGWLAMLTKSACYNQTYVHRGFSFELTLFDAQLLLAASPDKKYILAGGFEELTAEYFIIRHKIAYYKTHAINSLSLLSSYDTPGSIGGEGAHFFTLSNDPGNSFCAIHTIKMLQKPSNEMLQAEIDNVLMENQLKKDDIDVMICGMNGDNRNLFLVDPLLAGCSVNTTIVTFKQLSGEYDTASGFGLWLANYIFKHKNIPSETVYKQGLSKAIKNMLICNVTIGCNVSLMLLNG
jgi:3-oxoacyl-[acyl-carrier-protein] synthase II